MNEGTGCAFAREASILRIEFNAHRAPVADEELSVTARRIEKSIRWL